MMYPAVGVYALSTTSVAARAWSLYGDGHVLDAAIVDNPAIEAQILLDGTVLYRSRHATLAAATQELGELRWRWSLRGWTERA